MIMNGTTKISVIGTLLAVASLSILLSYPYVSNAMAFVATGNIPDDGIISERQKKGINAGYTGYGFFDRSVFVHISSGNPDDPHEINSALRGIENAKMLHDAGHNVVIFLDVDGVRLVDDNHPQSLDAPYAGLKDFLNDGGRVIACDLCGGSTHVKDLLRGVEIDLGPTMPKMQRLLMESNIILDY